jgi:hypothetical protein
MNIKINNPQVATRPHANTEIIALLDQFFSENPTLRFIQGLWALSIAENDKFLVDDDKFNEESVVTLKKLKECLSFLKSAAKSETNS